VRRQRVRVSDNKGKQRGGWEFSCSRGCEGGLKELKKIPIEGALDNKHQSLNCN